MPEPRQRNVFVTQDYPPDLGGMARRHVELCRRLGDETIVSTVRATDGGAFDRGEPYEIQRMPFAFGEAKGAWYQVQWSRHLVKALDPRHTVLHVGNIRPCGYAATLATWRVPVPYVIYVNGSDVLRLRRKTDDDAIKRLTARILLARTHGVVANSRWTGAQTEELMAAVGVRKMPPVAAIDLGTDPVQFAPARDLGRLRVRYGIGPSPLLVTVARLVPHKGHDMVIRAMPALGGNVWYLILGPGPNLAALQELASRCGVAERVVFAGVLPDDEIAEAYATADVYVGLSRVANVVEVEGFGISFVEASASGVPVVAGDSGGVRSAVRDGETGLVVKPTDLEAITSAVRRLLDNVDLRKRLGARGRALVETHYNWDRVARETKEFVARVTSVGA